MQTFHCDRCDGLLFFENFSCGACGEPVAFLPEQGRVGTLAGKAWAACQGAGSLGCNWGVAAGDGSGYCRSCRLTRTSPDLGIQGNGDRWVAMEAAKRRLLYGLMRLQLPVAGKAEQPATGLAFDFRGESVGGVEVLTGHEQGVITVNVLEADDAERERRRLRMGEPYRTLLGHFRHEIGHYYWDLLVRDRGRLQAFREAFGNESLDYGDALKRHYEQGPPPDWQARHVSSYAASHPWEDWAETWAHYLHLVDSLETAADCGLSMQPARRGEPLLLQLPPDPLAEPFERLTTAWFALTYALNNLNRSMGLRDAYPFVLQAPVLAKLRWIHDLVRGEATVRAGGQTSR
jgi:hypothetical protein